MSAPSQEAAMPERTGPLTDMKVLDIATMIAAPTAATFLADFGADVIKAEMPVTGDSLRQLGPFYEGKSLRWSVNARNKRSLTIDFHKPEGQAIVRDLVREYDVVTENFRPGVLDRWNLGYEQLRAVNPRVILLSISAYGQTGPYRTKAGFGRIIEAVSGMTSLTGFPGGPPVMSGFLFVDRLIGVMGALAVMMADHERQRSGLGQWIDQSVNEGILRILEPLVAEYAKLGKRPPRTGNRNPNIAPGDLYLTKDGKYVFISAATQAVFERLMRAIGREDTLDDPRFRKNADRMRHPDEINQIVADWFATQNLADAVELLESKDVPVGPVNEIADIVEDAQHMAREAIVKVADPLLGEVLMPTAIPFFSRTPGKVWGAGPQIGEHGDEILKSVLGYSDEKIERLRADGVI
jgi:crotonobetainyl-CoA:carnitine CoA-transferase CaiB-like acyl-CoA transferase